MSRRALSAEGFLLFAILRAHCAELGPRRRAQFLRSISVTLEDWENAPVSVRAPDAPEAIATAADWFRKGLPKLMG